ncbi:hypothetical protein EGR_00612 [Echinococcus granulosus]|uniref:Uncharacterized protein n=1 Tax=Echinococcus granulosus TaxID=6210 RepID=W6V173_ECHGR|nr:hypothetical protein EGR_00612 [Echinococcus granulosus]EUB64662.1 hypothetical protein EGR_00612 [Echinococcus granulosus]
MCLPHHPFPLFPSVYCRTEITQTAKQTGGELRAADQSRSMRIQFWTGNE